MSGDPHFDVSYRFDDALRPKPNSPGDMARAVQWYLALARDPSASLQARARDLGRAGIFQAMLGELQTAEAILEEALRLESEGDDACLGVVLRLRLAQVFQWQDRFREADEILNEALRRCREGGAVGAYLDFALQHAGKCKFEQAEYAAAVSYLEEALALRLQKGDADLLASTRHALEQARRLYLSGASVDGEAPVANGRRSRGRTGRQA